MESPVNWYGYFLHEFKNPLNVRGGVGSSEKLLVSVGYWVTRSTRVDFSRQLNLVFSAITNNFSSRYRLYLQKNLVRMKFK